MSKLLPVIDTLPDTDAMVAGPALCSKYITAQIKYLRIAREVAELAAEGKHKRKNKIIHSTMRKASMAKNITLRDIESFLNAAAKDQV
jgi:hypothetical protein